MAVQFSNITDMKRQRVQTAFPTPVNKQMEHMAMPATSKSQWRFMEGVKHGSIKRPGLSPDKAAEFVTGSPKGLPEKVKAPRRKAKFPRP